MLMYPVVILTFCAALLRAQKTAVGKPRLRAGQIKVCNATNIRVGAINAYGLFHWVDADGHPTNRNATVEHCRCTIVPSRDVLCPTPIGQHLKCC